MGSSDNQTVWDRHYLEQRSRQRIPDENIVRFYQHYLRKFPENNNPVVLEIGSGSGRNLSYLQSFTDTAFGLDFAINALQNQQNVVCGLAFENPFFDQTFDIVIAWGVLHYLDIDDVKKTIQEVKRVLKPGGIFYGTIRSDMDTHLKQVLSTGDLADGSAKLYSKEEALDLFTGFQNTKLGFIMRQTPGDDKIIAHHIFETTK